MKARKVNGQYDFSNMDLMCKCGHTLSVHAGESDVDERPCFNEDCGDGKPCKCRSFDLTERKKTEAGENGSSPT